MENDKYIADVAADKLNTEKSAAMNNDEMINTCKNLLKEKRFDANNKNMLDLFVKMRSSLIDEIVRMLTRFCYQNEEFAREVVECKRSVCEAVDGIMKTVGLNKPQLSDVEAYAAAVQFYIPSAQVTVSFRLNIPCEIDDDLLSLEDDANYGEEKSRSIILDLFNTEE